MATFVDNTVFLFSHKNHVQAINYLQVMLNHFQSWLQKMESLSKWSQIFIHNLHTTTFGNHTVTLNGIPIPSIHDVRYLRLHLDKKLTCNKHILAKGKEFEIKQRRYYSGSCDLTRCYLWTTKFYCSTDPYMELWYPTLWRLRISKWSRFLRKNTAC